MKRILFFFAATILFSTTVFSQGSNCASATPFCGDVTFPNNTATVSQSGPSYGCLLSQPNPAWFIIKTTAAGTMNFTISQTSSGGSGIDVDFIAWGPYSSTANICNTLTGSCSGDHACSGQIEDCSYSTAAVETMTLVSPSAGQYYIILITNYADVAGTITFDQTSGPATDCSITCPSVTAGNGYLLAGGGNMPATIACSAASIGLIASNSTPFGNPITPGVMISFTSNTNNTLRINWYENAAFVLCAGAGGCGLTIPTNTNEDIQFSTMSPSATNQIEFCETSNADGDMPYTIVDCASGTVLNTGTWVTDGGCTTVTFPPGTISGVSTWSISPACPGCLTTTDWGYAQFNPGVAPAGAYNICYSFDPPGTCPTYTYCQSITVTNPNNAAWTTPAAMCANAAAVNLNTLITGTAGGTWSGTGVSGNTFNPATSGAGTFNVTYTVGSGTCAASVVHAITVNPVPTVSISPASSTVCAGTSVTLTATPSIGGGTYVWAPGGATTAAITVSPGSTTTYTVTYTVAGCSGTASRLITVNPIPTVTAAAAPATICNGSSTTLTATPSTGGGTYAWAPGGATTASISVSPAATTTYTVTYTLAGCSNTGTVTVNVNTVPTVSISPATSTICSGTNATLTATPSTGGGTYSWAPGGATTAAITVSPGTSTTYTVTYTLSGCSTTATRLITVNTTPTVSVNTPAAICSGTGSATLTATPSAGGGTYSWAPGGATTAAITVSPASTTTYTVTYTLSGCSNTGTSTVTVNTTPTVSISPATSTICAGSSATLTATPSAGGGTYLWSPGGATTAAITVSPAGSTTYTVTYTLAGCVATATRLITVNSVPTVTVNTPAAVCSGTSVTLTATPSTGGGTYAWLPGGATTQSITVSPAGSTTYTVTYTLSGCSNTGTSVVSINPVPTVSISPATSTICAGASATLTATPSLGGGTYSWAPGGQTTAAITVSPAGTTTYTVTYTLSGCVGTATRTVTVNPLDNATFNYSSSTFCQTGTDPSATGIVTPGTFSSTPAGLVFLNTTTGLIDVSASALGTYTVTYTTTGTCPNTSAIPITITSAPSANFSYAGPFCQNATNPSPTFPVGSSAGTFTSTPAGLVFVSSSTGQINLTASTPGTYNITNTIAAAGGCASAVFGPVSVTINPSPTISATPTSQTICSGTATSIALSSSLGSTTYSWTVTQLGVTGGGAGSGTSIAQTLSTTGGVAGSATYTVTSMVGGCAGNTLTIPVTVNPVPSVSASPTAQTICSGSTTSISLSGTLAGTTFSWVAPSQLGVTGGSAGSGASIVQTLSASGTASGTATYNVIPTANSCPGTGISVIITVNPTPVVTATPLTSAICSGSATSIALSSATSGTTFAWTASNGAGITGAASGSGANISQVLNNSSAVSSTATYTITPTAASCPGLPVIATVTVNPTPTVTASPSVQTICSGSATNIPLSGTVAGTTFSWTVQSQIGASGATAGSGSSIAQTLLTTGSGSGTVVYSVTPTAGTCVGTSILVTITVNPIPFATATPVTSTICSGATSSVALSSFTSGTTFSWTAANGTNISGATSSSGSSIAQVLTNSGTTVSAATYTVTPSAAGCPGSPVVVTVNVNPVPNVIATPPAQSICSGSTTSIALTSSVAGTTFAWGAPATTGTATGGTAGSGSSIAQVLTVSGTTSGTVTYNVVPTANSCPAASTPIIITVNPNPIVTATPVATTLCSGGTTSIPLSGNIAGTTFSWTVTSTGVLGAAGGSGSNISQTLTTTGAAPGTVTYSVIASTPSGCTASTSPIIITVNPIPDVVATPSSQTICSGTAPSIALTGAVSGTTFSWTVVESGVTGATAASGSSIAQTLTATGTSPGTATYTITPSANGCSGNSITVVITVNPNPVVTATPPSQSLCNGSATSISLTSNLGATTFDWTIVPTGVTGAAAGTGSSISQLLNLTSSTVGGDVVYTITPTDNGCAGTPVTVTVTVNPIDNPSFTYASSTYCQTGTDPTPTITGALGGVFHFSPAGLVIDSVSGLIDLSTSAIGTYVVTYQTNGICPNNAAATITVTNAPSATFMYAASVCSSDPNPTPNFAPGASAGIFTASPAGLVFVDSTTGEINLLLSAAGTYTLTNSIAPGGGCAAASATGTINISQAATVDAGLNDTICELEVLNLAGTIGGSATSVLWTTPGTGSFGNDTLTNTTYTPSATDVSAGLVVLTITTNDPAGSCPSVTDFAVLYITPLDSANFSYSSATFCASGTDPVPTVTGMPGGMFTSSPAGLVFVNALTGEIDLSASTLGTYNVVYSTNGPCPSADTVSVTITNAPSATFTFTTGATAFCQTSPNPTPVFGSGASAGIFTATPAGLVFVSGLTGEIDLAGSTPGTYLITNTILAAGGCASAVDSLTITINQPATANAGNDTSVCAGLVATLNGNIGGSATGLIWTSNGTGTFGNDTVASTTYTPSVADTTSGSVTLYLTTNDPAGACGSVLDSMVLTITPLPSSPIVVTPGAYCAGSTINPLTASSTGGTISWYGDAALTTFLSNANPFTPTGITGTTSFWVTETVGACTSPSSAQVTITINPLPVADTSATTTTSADCGTATGAITGITMTSGASPFTYVWQDAGGATVGINPDLTGVGPGVYTLTITDANGCSITLSGSSLFNITSTSGVTASFTSDVSTGEKPLPVLFTNTSVGGVSYIWDFGTGDTTHLTNPGYTFTETGVFTVCLYADNGAGCADTACSTINVFINSTFVIPNIFTPNDDGVNDIFTVKNVGLESLDAEIYNRWGQKEYEWHKTNGGWDGRTTSGVYAPDGQYFFIIKAKGIDGKDYFEKGAFTLIR